VETNDSVIDTDIFYLAICTELANPFSIFSCAGFAAGENHFRL
jgi:hypothetical protein